MSWPVPRFSQKMMSPDVKLSSMAGEWCITASSLKAVPVCRTQCYLVRGPSHKTSVLPGEYIELIAPDGSDSDATWALELRLDVHVNRPKKQDHAWPPSQEVSAVGRSLRITNHTQDTIMLKKHKHIGQLRQICLVDNLAMPQIETKGADRAQSVCHTKPFSSSVEIDPDNRLTKSDMERFSSLHIKYDDVLNPAISKYNSRSGNIEAVVNMGPT